MVPQRDHGCSLLTRERALRMPCVFADQGVISLAAWLFEELLVQFVGQAMRRAAQLRVFAQWEPAMYQQWKKAVRVGKATHSKQINVPSGASSSLIRAAHRGLREGGSAHRKV